MVDIKTLTKINNKKLLEDQLEIWRSLNRIAQIQERTLGIIEKILDLPKAVLKGVIVGLIVGIIVTVGVKLWLQASPDGRLNSYMMLFIFVAGVIVTKLVDSIRDKKK